LEKRIHHLLSMFDNKKLNILVSNTYEQPFDVLIANTDTLKLLRTTRTVKALKNTLYSRNKL